jgi:hypothetical protein
MLGCPVDPADRPVRLTLRSVSCRVPRTRRVFPVPSPVRRSVAPTPPSADHRRRPRRHEVQMLLAVTRWWEVHCSHFTIRCNTAIRFVPGFSERLQARANPSQKFRLSQGIHQCTNLCHNSRHLSSGDRVRNREANSDTEVALVTGATTRGP